MNDKNSGGNDDFPRYEPTDHPEDQPSYGSLPSYGGSHESGSYESSGNQGYAGYQAQDNTVNSGGFTGKPSAIDSISWAFRTVFKNWKLWILGALLVGVIVIAVSGVSLAVAPAEGADASGAGSIVQIVSYVIMVVVSLLAMRLALFQIDDPRTGWSYVGKDVRWWQPLVIMIIIGIISSVVMFIFVGGSIFLGPDAGADATEDEALEAMASFFGVMAVVALIGLFIQPLYMLMQWFAADGDGVGQAIKNGFKAGKENYGQLLLLTVLNALIMIAGGILLLVGLIVAVPVTLLATAYLFRQCAGRATGQTA
ncbi:hypothetical protein [Corynebacterium rhinophilum]|uniref:hypothetical protein n=1 Tax=Corynebacterium rhinophilum TaxID=3050197 RepID=UPI00254E2F66|nr:MULTISPECIES: hypothetical protein [unclassified Corynebacterium]MDK8452083.1 hypothetical protein [Corynebacterium sp. MSK084]MDK8466600.1 hypothetical protein [Corynebacterium sp. MSK130]MDK8491432.1 hypothetical protein [Corynebacterium sp. MSK175]MDK8514020.1 hypothetical protein [Corynebacterium sp. MSK123]MDK8547232.1 hypothetical protein [Corynebacterium sp. MSK222]